MVMLWSVLFGFLAACGVSLMFNAGEYSVAVSNNFMCFVIFLIYVWLYRRLCRLSSRQFWCGGVFCLIMACCLVLGVELEMNSEIDWSVLTLVRITGLTFALYPLMNLALSWIDLRGKKKVGKQMKRSGLKCKKSEKLILKDDCCLNKMLGFAKRHKLLSIFLVIWFFGFLVVLAVYPGVYGYDAGSQLSSVFSDEVAIRDHFSVPFVLLLSGVIRLGKWIFGNYNAGYVMFVLLQLAFMSFVVARLCLLIWTEFKSKKLFYASVVFFCFFPLYTVTVASVIQDVYFAGLTVLLFIELYLMCKDPGEYWKKRLNYLIFGGLVLGICLARNNGMYMLIIALPIINFATKKGKRLLTCVMVIIPVVVYLIIKIPIYNILGVEKGNAVMEMSSIPSQQLARVFVKHKNELNEEQIVEIRKYYNTDYFEKYYELNPSISDWMKAGINSDMVKSEPLGYITLWMKYGLKYPLDYIDAFAMNTYAFWYPNKLYPDTRMYHPLIEYESLTLDERINYLNIERSTKFPLYDELLRAVIGSTSQVKAARGGWEFLPVISTFFTLGFYFMIVLACMTLTFLYRKWHLFVPLAIVVGLYCTLLLSPVALFRYCLPVVVLAPFMVGMCITSSKD